jgi:ATP synthase protein I
MTSSADGQQSASRGVGVPGRREHWSSKSLWLKLLALSSTAAVAALIATSAVAAVLNGFEGALSAAFGGGLVMLFFAISLLIGHYVGRNNPSGAVGLFVATYFVKVVGFAVVLFILGAPEWLHDRWFLIGAVVSVIAWQATEIYGFGKARLQLYNDPASDKGGDNVNP